VSVCVCASVCERDCVFSVYTYTYIHMRTCIHHSLMCKGDGADCSSRKAIAFQKLNTETFGTAKHLQAASE
jgi:hypothetical protein